MPTNGSAIPIDLPPGINKQGTEYETQGRWRDAENIRFFQRLVQPRGSKAPTELTGLSTRAGGAHSWVDNAGTATLAVGGADALKITQSNLSGTYADITPVGFVDGRDDSARQYGYGIGLYGREEYGDARTEDGNTGGLVSEAQNWSLHNRGQDLIASAWSDGKIYIWFPPDTGVAATQLANSPSQVTGTTVTPLQHVVALGADGDPRKIAWSDNVDPTVWTPDGVTNQAGFLILQDDTVPIAAVPYRKGVVVWTRNNAFELRSAPRPFWWTAVTIGESAGIASPRAFATDGIRVAWMGRKNFWLYDGSQTRPLACDVQDYVFGQLNSVQLSKINAAHLPEYSEFTWYYPAATNAVTEFVTWNYAENHWTTGKAEVETYLPQSVFDSPLSWNASGTTFAEEQPPAVKDACRLTSSAIELQGGNNLLSLHYLVPDWTIPDNILGRFQNATLTVYGKNSPSGKYVELGKSNLFNIREDGIPLRGRARQIKVELLVNTGTPWELGRMRLWVSQRSRRG